MNLGLDKRDRRDSNGVDKKKAYSLLVCCGPMLMLVQESSAVREWTGLEEDNHCTFRLFGGAQGMGRFPWAFGLPNVLWQWVPRGV